MKTIKMSRFLILMSIAAIGLLITGSSHIASKKGNVNETNIQAAQIRDTVERFVTSLKNNDLQAFKQQISPSGLVIIRNFLTGGYGVRGKDIRYNYSLEQIPVNLKFLVKGEAPVDPYNLFKGSIKIDSKGIPLKVVEGYQFKFQNSGKPYPEPSTLKVAKICLKIRSTDKNDDSVPRGFILGENEFVLTESMVIDGLPLGSWAIFEKSDDKYLLRAIIDFR